MTGATHRVLALATFVLVVAAGCGGGGGSDNSQPAATATPTPRATATTPAPGATSTADGVPHIETIVVDPGPTGTYVNGLFATITVCAPGSVSCVTVDHVLVDTGSSGVRILASALPLTLPTETDAGGGPIAECFPFLDAFTWGPIRFGDVVIGAQAAHDVPLQVIGDPTFAAPPDGCTGSGLPAADTLDKLGANGILGIGVFRQDCGAFCASSGGASGNVYFTCAGAACDPVSQAVDQQVQNPVWLMPGENNGVVIELPSISDAGAPTATGSLTLGIGTNDANALGAAQALPLTTAGTFTTVFNGESFAVSFVDTGSNGFFFLDPATTGIPTCNTNADFYCPPSTLSLQATQHATNGTEVAVGFQVANARTLFANQDAFAYDDLAGPGPHMFDWGLPFFFGRRVLVAIEGQSTPAGAGPYVAY